MLSAVTYTSNYFHGGSWTLGHLWSLSVEEQFYLLWPALLVALFRRRIWLAGTLLALAPPLPVLFWTFWGIRGLKHPFPAVMDAVAAGCGLAMLEPKLRRHDAWLRDCWFLIVPALTALVPMLQIHHHRAYQVAGLTVMYVGIALSIAHTVRMEYRVLNWWPVVWLGTISYSFYLWQQPFLNRRSTTWWTAFPQNFLLALSCATVSYYGVEKPFLEFRERRKERVLLVKKAAASGHDDAVFRKIA